MNPVDRLAAYVAGDLDAAERAALEADLVRDPVLRAQLDAMQRADTALGGLRTPTTSPGFEERLQRALAVTLDEELGSAPVDDLSARRSTRAVRPTRGLGWPRLLVGGAAAAAILVVGGVVVLSGLGGSDDATEDGMAAMDQDDAAMESFTGPAAQAPTIVAAGREFDDAALDALRDSDELGLSQVGLDDDAGRQLATTFQAALGSSVPGPEAGVADELDASDGAADAPLESDDAETQTRDTDRPVPELRTQDGTLLPLADRANIARCLDELLSGGDDAIPVYVELATYEGEPAVVFGLVTSDPATGAYTRAEMWALDAATCQVLRFSQR